MAKTFLAVSAIIGTVIGAGILAIPYVIMQSGYALGLVYLVFFAIVMATAKLYLGEIVLRTKTIHQLPGYAQKYLGNRGKMLMFLAMAFGVYSAMIAYLIAEGESWSNLLFGNSNYSFLLGIAVWLFISLLAFLGLKALEEGESLGVSLVFITIISIVVLFAGKIDPSNLATYSPSHIFTPVGVILFSLLGFTIIPELKRILGKNPKPMKRAIILSYLLILIIYIAFTTVVVGFKGAATPEIATLALGKPFICLGILTILTAYLAVSVAMIDMLRLDFKKTKKIAWAYATLLPLAGYIIISFITNSAFSKVLGIGGAISGGLTAILILLMAKKAKKKGKVKPPYSMPVSKWFIGTLIALFSAGVIIELKNLLF